VSQDIDFDAFSLAVSADTIFDLRARLANTRWPDELPDAGWDYGTNRDVLHFVCDHWASHYDWEAFTARANAHPQTLTTIEGQRIHCIHARSPEPMARPLIITHGWPGSVAEFYDVIGPLSDPVRHGGDPADAFHVVCPSLPGYGSRAPRTSGVGMRPELRTRSRNSCGGSATSGSSHRAAIGDR
jgi:microsomal epoxide hydrolase